MEKFKLLRAGQEVAAGTLAAVYDALHDRTGNGWAALHSGGYQIMNPDGTERARDYDEHGAQERRHRKALFMARRAKLAEIVKALGWQPVIKKDSEEGANGNYYPDNVYISAEKGGASFSLHIGYAAKGKARISGNYEGRHHYGAARPSINVSFERDAKAAARDIARRFLPDFLKAHAEHLAKEAAADDYESRTQATLELVKGWPLSEREKEAKTIWDGLPEDVHAVKVYGPESVRLEFTTKPETARQILDLLRSLAPKEAEA